MEATSAQHDYLSKTNSECLKGIFAVCVLLHHLYQHSGVTMHPLAGAGLQYLGYFSVGVFFFLSGFGLMQSYKRKGKVYIDTFPRKRLLPFYMMILVLIVIYSVYTVAVGEPLRFVEVVQSFLIGGTVISKGWYLQVQLLCYVLFYFAFRFCNKRSTGLIVSSVLTATYILVMIFLDSSTSWYVSTPLFVIGMWYSVYKDKINAWVFVKRRWLLTFLASGAVFFAVMLGQKLFETKYLRAMFLTLVECAFVFCLVLVLPKIRIEYQLTEMLGAISLEVYVMQGLCLSLFHSRVVTIQNVYLYAVTVTACTFLLAILIHPIIRKIFSLCGGNSGEAK